MSALIVAGVALTVLLVILHALVKKHLDEEER